MMDVVFFALTVVALFLVWIAIECLWRRSKSHAGHLERLEREKAPHDAKAPCWLRVKQLEQFHAALSARVAKLEGEPAVSLPSAMLVGADFHAAAGHLGDVEKAARKLAGAFHSIGYQFDGDQYHEPDDIDG